MEKQSGEIMPATNVHAYSTIDHPKSLKDLGLLTIRLGEKDNVLTALADIETGQYLLNGKVLVVHEKVYRGFKIATTPINRGGKIYKYNYPIGLASRDIKPGSLVHVHNVISMFNKYDEKR